MLYCKLSCTAAALLLCGGAHAAVRQSAGPVQQVLVASETNIFQNIQTQCDKGWTSIPGAFISLTIPPGSNQLLVARFNGSVEASESDGVANAEVRIVDGAHELDPAAADAGTSSVNTFQPPTSIERSGTVTPGAHTVACRRACSGTATPTCRSATGT
jgi:hypothetical protein